MIPHRESLNEELKLDFGHHLFNLLYPKRKLRPKQTDGFVQGSSTRITVEDRLEQGPPSLPLNVVKAQHIQFVSQEEYLQTP